MLIKLAAIATGLMVTASSVMARPYLLTTQGIDLDQVSWENFMIIVRVVFGG